MLKVVDDASVPNDNTESSGSSLLDEIVRDGARRMLAAARPVVLDLVIEQLGCVDLRAVALSSSGSDASKLGDLYDDAEIVRSAVADVDGSVVICAHSYGGAPVTEALASIGKVRRWSTSAHGRAT